MDGCAGGYIGALVTSDEALDGAFEERLRDSSALAFRVAYGVLRQRQDAEDVAQDALIKAHRCFRALRDRDKFRAWLVRVAWRMAIDRQRSERRRVAREQAVEPVSPAATPEEHAAARERAAGLWKAIDDLPEKLRVVVVLAGIEEHDVEAVARLLDVPEGTVKSRLFLARKRLAESLRWTAADSATR